MNHETPLPIRGGAKLPLRPMHVWGIRVRLQVQGRVRDLALFDIALDSKLRGCDIVTLRIGDVFAAGAPRKRGMVVQQKTGRPVHFEITEQTRRSLAAWLERRGGSVGDWLFPSRMQPGGHISTRQYFRLLKQWIRLIGLEASGYGTHSLRRTKVSLLYRKTGNLRACQLLLGHTKLESTVRYLGVEVDDALQLSEALEL
ncbi:tyrosine-type recombinase/integrase [Sphingomonas rhizophila]|uniref:Tyrosine-type recombinase/integrase n=1 Tax=Sphingomonas rhizophila TaxID=2071607 RepID=A0A7G9SBM9_9SPHN|nr:tyrosine-type recombinase/integrase [Sphingomonas rhizophila]QNN65254.1 tyrosine-type recombinase/integrase [Sphingomonas rhizophila]